MIYRLRFDRLNFMLFDIPPNDIEYILGDIFLLNDPTSTWADFWKPLQGEFTDWSDDKNVINIPDITCWFTNELVLNQKAYDALAKDLKPYGEFLPMHLREWQKGIQKKLKVLEKLN